MRYDYSCHGYFYTDHAYELPAAWISETNILALALAVQLASTVPAAALKEEFCRLTDKMIPLAGKGAGSCLETVGTKISVKNIEYSRVDGQCFRQLIQALFEERSLAITYHSTHSGVTSQRVIHPLHLMHYMGNWHLLAWCGKRQEISDFALSRIRDLRPEPRAARAAAARAARAIAAAQGIHSATVRDHAGIGERGGGASFRAGDRALDRGTGLASEPAGEPRTRDGALPLRFAVADFREITRRILSHGAQVRVVAPPALRALVQQEIAVMAGLYEK